MVKNAKCAGVRCTDDAACTAKGAVWRGNSVNVLMSASVSRPALCTALGLSDQGQGRIRVRMYGGEVSATCTILPLD